MGSDETLGDLPQRFLVRNTHTYTGLIERLLLPQHLTDGMAASIQADALARRFLYADQKPFAWPIIPFESDAVLQLDVPKFAFAPSDDALRFPPHGVIDAFFAETGLAAVQRRITALSSSDLARQLGFIRCSFNDTNGTNGTNGTNATNGTDAAVATRAEPRRSDGPLTRAEALEEAAAIADQLRRSAIHAGDGTVTWITYGYQMDAQFYQVQPMGLSLYDGVCGPGVFLAAVERATGGDGLRSLALATFKSFDDISSKEVQHRLLRDGIGAGLGLASIVYALLKTGELLGEDHLMTRAEQMAALITPGVIAADKRLDVVGGAAGCALVLAALYRTRPMDVIAELAVACGTHLLNTSTVSEDGLRSWRTIHGKRLAGFSHGAAGMAYALCRVFELSREARFRDAAAEACAFERSLYSEPERNWLNLLAPLKDGGYACWNSWCHGAPGIGLGRLGGLGVLDTPSVREDIAHSLACAGALPLNEVHHLCCGSLGRLDVLLEAGDALGDSTCVTQAALMAGRVVDEARTRGSYAGTVQAGVLVPAFFQGVSGVGYQLLRVSEPKTLPSVLRYA
jgi:type 2 lantibiotic biosynthesis protein LanM